VHHPGQQLEPEADRHLITDLAVGPDHGDMPLKVPARPGRVIDAGDERRLSTDQVAELIGDRAEHLVRAGTPADQRGHPPQRPVHSAPATLAPPGPCPGSGSTPMLAPAPRSAKFAPRCA